MIINENGLIHGSHNRAIRVYIIIAEEMNGVIRDRLVGLVREIPMNAFIIAVSIIIIWWCIRGFIEVCGRVWIVFAIIWEGPKLGLPSRSSHHFQDLPLVYVPSHRHFLRVHVYFKPINSLKNHIKTIQFDFRVCFC